MTKPAGRPSSSFTRDFRLGARIQHTYLNAHFQHRFTRIRFSIRKCTPENSRAEHNGLPIPAPYTANVQNLGVTGENSVQEGSV